MKRERILHIELQGGLGGIETFLINLYNKIDRDKYVFDFISTAEEIVTEPEIIALGGNIIKISDKGILKYCKELDDVIKNGNYSIVHIHKNSAANILPFFICKKRNVKCVIAHSHNTAPSKGKITRVLHYINRFYIRKNASCKVACSMLAGKWLYGNKEVEEGRIMVVNNGVDVDKFRFNPENRKRIREELKITSDTLVLGNVGRLVAQKNQKFLIDILFDLKGKGHNAKLVICGEGPLRYELEEYIRLKKLESDVMLLGNVNNVNDIMQAMDVFLLPSIYEGMPIVSVEAQCTGLPTLVAEDLAKEIDITDLYCELPINSGVKVWVEECLKRSKGERKDYSEIIDKNGYSIENVAKYMDKIYSGLKK